MLDLSGLRDLVLTVGGDITPLTSALDEIPAVAQQTAAQIQSAFDALPSATEEVNQSLANLSTGLSEAGSSASETAGHVAEVPPALHDTSEAAGEAGAKLKEFVIAGLELAGIALTFEALKEAVTEIVSAFDQLQRATISLTALTGSAEQATTAIDSLKTLAIGEGLSFPSLVTAQQRMYAFGISATQIPQLLQAAANAAAVMGTDIESAASRLDRIAVSGMAAARQLTQLGLTTHDLAQAMGVADSAAAAAFKSLDQSQRVEVLIAALQKFQGVAAAVADTLSGRWQSFKTSVEVALEGVGEAIDTSLVSTVETAQESVVPGIQAMTKAFQDLASVFGPIITGGINSFTQGMGDLLNVVSSGISELVTLGKSANDTGISFAQLVHYVADVTPWGLFADSIHQAAVDLNLLHASADMAAASMLVMDQRFASVTDSLKTFIDKTSAAHDTLLAVRTDYEALQKAVTDAKAQLDLVTEAYNKGMASAGQLEAATKALTAAQTALNGTMDASKFTMASIATAYDALKTALATANSNLTLVSKAYLDGKASLSQYQEAVAALKTAQDALNGSLKQTPMDEVNAALTRLQQNADRAQAYLNAVTEAMKTNSGAGVLLAGATKGVVDAQAALTGSTQTVTAAISSSAPKVIDVANALGSMATATSSAASKTAGFVGPIQQVNDAVQVLNGSVSTLTDSFDAAKVTVIGAGDAFSQTAQDLIGYINGAEQATAATDTLTEAMDNAASAAGSLGSQLNQTMATASEGGGTLGMHLNLKPGDVVSSPFTIGNVDTFSGGLPAGWFSGAGPVGVGRPNDTFVFDPGGVVQKNLNTAATNLTTAGAALSTAATAQQTAADAAQQAAWAAQDAAKMASSAAQIQLAAADSINSSALAAADAANTQAINNASFASVIANTNTTTASTVQALTLATNTIVGAASVITAVAVKAGIPLASNTLVGTGTTVSLPNVSTMSGANSGGLPFAPPVFPSSPQSHVSINVNGSNFLQQLMNEFVQNLQTQGVRLTRI